MDERGRAVRLDLSEGQRHEITRAPELLRGLREAYVAADRAYDSRALREQLRAQRCRIVIRSNPTRRVQRRYDRTLYKSRHHVENFFRRLERFRRIAMRYDRLAVTFLAMVSFAAVLTWLGFSSKA